MDLLNQLIARNLGRTFSGNREIALANGYKEVTDEDYAVIKAQRQAWRDRINEPEAERGEENGND